MEKWNSILILNCIDIKVHNNYLNHCYFGSQCYKVIGQKFNKKVQPFLNLILSRALARNNIKKARTYRDIEKI